MVRFRVPAALSLQENPLVPIAEEDWVLTLWGRDNMLRVPGVELRLFCRTVCCLVALYDY